MEWSQNSQPNKENVD